MEKLLNHHQEVFLHPCHTQSQVNMRAKVVLQDNITGVNTNVIWHYQKETLKSLHELIQSCIHLNNYTITFKDDDNDDITVLNQNDVNTAFDIAKSQNRPNTCYQITDSNLNHNLFQHNQH
eukprot:516486_1